MKQDLSLTKLAEELERRSSAKLDFLADTRQLSMTNDSSINGLFENDKAMNVMVNDIAHGQIASRLDIPAKYYNRLKSEAVKVLAKKNSLNEFEQGNILRHLIEGADLSKYGLLNAVTRTAQDVDDYDRATDLEALGGNILVLPRSEWKQLAEAA